MEIKNFGNNTKTPSFKGAMFINLAALDNERAVPVIKEFKKVLGQGLQQKQYKFMGKPFVQDVFIGYNKSTNPYTEADSYGILIATGLNPDSGGQLFAKLGGVDSPILHKINKVFEKFKLTNNPAVGVVKSSPSDFSGNFSNLGNDVDVVVSHTFLNDLDADFMKRTGFFYSDTEEPLNNNVVFSYQKKHTNVYKYLATGLL